MCVYGVYGTPQDWLSDVTFPLAPIQLHALSLATFASFIAPFGETGLGEEECGALQRLLVGMGVAEGRVACTEMRGRQAGEGDVCACAACVTAWARRG